MTGDDLTRFRLDILVAIGRLGKHNEVVKGVDIRDIIEKEYNTPVHHGRLYPNLDVVTDRGLVEKIEVDGRTNSYELTEAGRDLLSERQSWIDGAIVQEPEPLAADGGGS